MTRKRILVGAAAVAGLASAFAIGVAVGEQAPPTEAKGMNAGKPTFIDLGTQELGSLDGRQLRLRVITFEPGGVAPIHSHKGRPAVAYVAQGTLTEYREGGWVKEHPAGDTISEDKTVTHWAENTGNTPAVVVAVDVFKP
jgi:quercetin dioxygenase-like cupin family protein